MWLLIAAVVLLAACSYEYARPVGPSVSVPDDLKDAASMAIDYWNKAGLELDPPSDSAPIKISIDKLSSGKVGLTTTHVNGPPDIQLDPVVETWATGDKLSVAACTIAHEIGHAMGLQHASDPESVMYPDAVFPIPAEPGSTDHYLARGLMRNE